MVNNAQAKARRLQHTHPQFAGKRQFENLVLETREGCSLREMNRSHRGPRSAFQCEQSPRVECKKLYSCATVRFPILTLRWFQKGGPSVRAFLATAGRKSCLGEDLSLLFLYDPAPDVKHLFRRNASTEANS